ncbi:WXG100 family type VII secretion target [Nocardia sp. NPDC051787]|uniref:WXG100 family type VII secretion target n=1 Tax=Nocardia sp. NPDC051787 TaxID=3155415 RepID=UPI00344864F4
MSTPGGMPSSSQSLSVAPDQVRDVGNYVYGIADMLKGALDSVAREVDALTTSGWTGDASAGFAAGWSEVRDGGSQIMTALAGLAEKLGVTADTYERRDQTNADGLSGSSLDLP